MRSGSYIQGLSEKDGHHYAVLRGKDKTLYFDITAYWQHEYGNRLPREWGLPSGGGCGIFRVNHPIPYAGDHTFRMAEKCC